MFTLSAKSRAKLEGVDRRLVRVVEDAIEITDMDFSVTCGLRTLAEQKALYEQGLTHVIEKGKHLTGKAVDLYAWDGESLSDLQSMTPVFYAMRLAAIGHGVSLRWGGAWSIRDIRDWLETPVEAHQSYIRNRDVTEVSRDFVHFELS